MGKNEKIRKIGFIQGITTGHLCSKEPFICNQGLCQLGSVGACPGWDGRLWIQRSCFVLEGVEVELGGYRVEEFAGIYPICGSGIALTGVEWTLVREG